MATVLEGVLPSVLLCFSCGQNDSMQMIFIKKCFLFVVGSVCCIKQFRTGSKNSLKDVRTSQMMPNQVMRQQSKNFCAVGFDTLVKRWVEDMSRNKCFFPGSTITCFIFISICDIFTDSPSYLKSALVGGKWSASHSGHFSCRE
jgi:hypothetical protein